MDESHVVGESKRMRSWSRHEQQSIRMAMTVSGAPPGQKTATMAWREVRDEVNDAIGQTTSPSAAFYWIYEDAELWVTATLSG